MCQLPLPEPIAPFLATLAALVDARQADLLLPLFQGILFAHGRRTATAWFRAGDCAADFHRGYHLLGTLGRGRIDWLAEQCRDSTVPLWVVSDGGYTKRPVFKAAAAASKAHHVAVVLVGRLRQDAALWSLPPVVPEGQKRGRGQPRKYGTERLHLAKRAAHPRGWQEVECFQ